MVLDFLFRGLPVGYFEEPACPRNGGRYRYVQYRGPGHYEMGRALADGPVRCSFRDDHAVVEFIVTSIPEYGVVQIDQVFPCADGPLDPAKSDGLVHEIWRDADGLAMCCLAGPAGDGARGACGAGADLVHVFAARTHFEAMSIYNAYLQREPYSTSEPWDFELYPESWRAEQSSTEASWREMHARRLATRKSEPMRRGYP